MGEVVEFTGETFIDLPAEKVLDAAREQNLKDAIVIGSCENDDLYFAGTTSDVGRVILLLELAKQQLLESLAEE